MPAWLATILVKFVLPLIIQWAVKHNLIGEVTAALAEFGLELKTFHEPSDFPQPPPATPTPNNLAPQRVQ